MYACGKLLLELNVSVTFYCVLMTLLHFGLLVSWTLSSAKCSTTHKKKEDLINWNCCHLKVKDEKASVFGMQTE